MVSSSFQICSSVLFWNYATFLKLGKIISDSDLTKYMNQLIPYVQQTIPGSDYNVEDEFNSYTSKLNSKFSVFHLNIRSLNCHHKELIAYFFTGAKPKI